MAGTTDMVHLYLVYGLAFFLLGSALGLQARSPPWLFPSTALWCLSGFGFVHGAAEWATLGRFLGAGGGAGGAIPIALTALSFGLLLQFAVELLHSRRPGLGRLRWLPAALLAGTAAAGLAFSAGTPAELALAVDEVLVRYLLGVPGGLLAAAGLLVVLRDPRWPLNARQRGLLRLGAATLGAYALLAGAVPPPADFAPASFLNTETFRAALSIPVELPRLACALAIGFALTEMFVVEAARARREAERQREEFVSVVVHDLKNAITPIALCAGRIERLPPEDHGTERERSLLASLRTSSTNLARMANDLLDASRIEARRLELRLEEVEVGPLVAASGERAAAVTRGHPLRIATAPSLPRLLADPVRLEQVLLNLLSNAGKYATPETPITVDVEPFEGELVFSVGNEGPPIPEEAMDRIFARFFRAPEAERSRTPGLGLGLYIAKGLVTAHGGRIWVESGAGRTSFRFAIPAPAATGPRGPGRSDR